MGMYYRPSVVANANATQFRVRMCASQRPKAERGRVRLRCTSSAFAERGHRSVLWVCACNRVGVRGCGVGVDGVGDRVVVDDGTADVPSS